MNNRLFLSPDSSPTILWNLIEGAKTYKLSMYLKRNKKLIWEVEVEVINRESTYESYKLVEFPEGSGKYFGSINYPMPSNQYPLLVPNEIYLFIGETNNSSYYLDCEAEIMLLDNSTSKAVKELKAEILRFEDSKTSDSSYVQPLIEKLTSALEKILAPTLLASGLPRWLPGPMCFYLNFDSPDQL